jgi:predicted ATPase
MITGIKVRNFKSLSDFSLTDLPRFSCLIGLNGSGKTTVLQLFDFIGQLMHGRGEMRGWNPSELITSGSPARTIHLTVNLLITNKELTWSGAFNIDKQRMMNEQIIIGDGTELLKVDKGRTLLLKGEENSDKKDIGFLDYQGSFLSSLNTTDPLILAVKNELANLKSFDLLSPASLRSASKKSNELGLGGDGLPGFLSQLDSEQSKNLMDTLSQFYPRLQAFEIKRRQFGWRILLIKEYQRTVQAGHVNDGLLRILAILSQRYSLNGFLFFDEIENGINQEIVQKLVEQLQNFGDKQVMVSTHSAQVLNYLDDSTAKKSVYLLYQDKEGLTHACKFYDISSVSELLEFMGPGQAMSQTNLIELATGLCQKNANDTGKEG